VNALRIGCLLAAVTVAAAGGGTVVQNAPATAAKKQNPLESDGQAQRAGAKLYIRECAACHGMNRKGSRKAPPLNRPDIRGAASGTLFWVLRNGAIHRGMPSFAHLPEAQRWQIVTFLRSQ
jgi:mono/diheme cytochrome c family protein